MRFCINGRQPYSVIKKADEIKFAYADKDKIIDLVENYSDKIIILDVPGDESDWTKWKMYDEVFVAPFIGGSISRYMTLVVPGNLTRTISNGIGPSPLLHFMNQV